MNQMENVIARLSGIDAEAQKIMNQATEKKKEMENDSRQRQQEFDRELEGKTRETLISLRENLENKNRQQIAKLREENEKALADLEENYRCSHEQLAEAIFRKVIEVS